ncbi:hypothetical protein Ddye_012229 [Dipteronia dyeriana]|uniref:Uncharacterized protein n=1 Tax=Dipteronia dyeriana TaxID=168575 RepID=A0AAD9X459_9ROSI|nr:hypothetical protein Ddye_012229 [Dipteronia dyeriana]
MNNSNGKRSIIQDWLSSCGDNLKFNVDGFVIGISDSNTAEVWAVKKATDLCISNAKLRGRFISIVSDSKVVVSWVNNGDFGKLYCVNSIYQIRSAIRSLGGVEDVYDPRAFYSSVCSLAKKGPSKWGAFVEWGILMFRFTIG